MYNIPSTTLLKMSPNQQPTKIPFPTTSYQLNMSTPPSFSPTQKCYFPFIQTIYSVALANLHTFVKVPPTHTENSFTKQHPHLIKYAEMNQKSVSLNLCHYTSNAIFTLNTFRVYAVNSINFLGLDVFIFRGKRHLSVIWKKSCCESKR